MPTKHDIQQRLLGLGYPAGPTDDLTDPMTIDAIKRFQAQYKLDVTGVIDHLTIAALNRAAHRSSAPPLDDDLDAL